MVEAVTLVEGIDNAEDVALAEDKVEATGQHSRAPRRK
jgi:hypothetical protein